MSDVDRLEDELVVAKLRDKLEETREAMHADRTPETVKAYKEASKLVAEARSAFRRKHQVPAAEGDGVAEPDTVKLEIGVEQP